MIEALLFGILQGIFEWLPISSQGNLTLLMTAFFGYASEMSLKYSVFLHTGTLLAVIVYFRRDVADILLSLKNYRPDFSEDNRLFTFLLVSTVITGLVGYPIFRFLTLSSFTGEVFIALVGVALIITGLLQKFSKQRGLLTEKNLGIRDTLLLGLAQGLSVIPGISRSGITVSSFLLRGYSSDQSLRLSFLMSIPAVLVAEIGLTLFEGLPGLSITESLLGLVSSFAAGIISIHVLLRAAKKIRFWLFCVIIGIIALVPLVLLF